MPLHVLLMSRAFPHHRAGGMEWHVQDIAEGLMAAGHTVSVLTTPLPRPPALKGLQVNGHVFTAGNRPAQYDLKFFAGCWKLRPRIRALRPDVIHAQGYTGIPAQFFYSKIAPVVTTVHGTLWSETPLRRDVSHHGGLSLHWRYKHRHAIAPLWRRFLRRARWIIVDSKFTALELKHDAMPRHRPIVVPLGFDLDRFPLGDRAAARAAFSVGPDDVLLAAVGRLEEVKRPCWILESFLRLAPGHPNLRLVLAGEGSQSAALRRRAEASPHRDRISLPGRLPAEEITRLYQAADLFLNPDHGAPAFGLSNAEALSMGTPVLTTSAGAHGEVVPKDDPVSKLVECGNFKAWAGELEAALKHIPEQREVRAQRANQARRRFNRHRMIARLVSVYGKMG